MKQDVLIETNENKYAIREQASKKEIDLDLAKGTRANASEAKRTTATIDKVPNSFWKITFKGIDTPVELSGTYTTRQHAETALVAWKNSSGAEIVDVRGFYDQWTRSNYD
jgi:hypothetical protein